MYFYWDHRNADIGYHSVVLKHSDGKTVPGSEVSLWDYTCDFQQRIANSDSRMKDVAYRLHWFSNMPYQEEYLNKDGLKLKDVQRKIEIGLMQGLIEAYKSALIRAEQIRPYAEWAEHRLTENMYQLK